MLDAGSQPGASPITTADDCCNACRQNDQVCTNNADCCSTACTVCPASASALDCVTVVQSYPWMKRMFYPGHALRQQQKNDKCCAVQHLDILHSGDRGGLRRHL